LHDSIIPTRVDVWAHITTLTLQLLIKVLVPRQKNER